MKEQDIKILGICRFSMLGRGDWKAYRNRTDDELESIYEEKAKELFAPERLEARLETFEHLTLASMRGQGDPNFTFLVVSSDRMPQKYRDRLSALCASVPQVVLRFVPPMHISQVVRDYFVETETDMADVMQFRLDDDDCLSRDYIRRLRRHGAGMWRNAHFAVSFPSIYYCITDGPTEGIYRWFSPFFSAGACVRHSSRTVFDFGHYKIQENFVAVTDPHFPCIVTHRGDNDTPRHAPEILRKRGMSKAEDDQILTSIKRHFDFLTIDGMRMSTFDRVPGAEPPALLLEASAPAKK